MIDLAKSRNIIILTIIGAIVGVYTATIVSSEQFLSVFKYLMLVMLLVILVKPERWLITSGVKSNLPGWISIPAFLLLGFYGGFIQMGMGIFFLAVLSKLGSRYYHGHRTDPGRISYCGLCFKVAGHKPMGLQITDHNYYLCHINSI